jgi:hypothetical protein
MTAIEKLAKYLELNPHDVVAQAALDTAERVAALEADRVAAEGTYTDPQAVIH